MVCFINRLGELRKCECVNSVQNNEAEAVSSSSEIGQKDIWLDDTQTADTKEELFSVSKPENRPDGRSICDTKNQLRYFLHFPLDFLLAGFPYKIESFRD